MVNSPNESLLLVSSSPDGVLGRLAEVLRQPPQVGLVPPQSVHRLPAAGALRCLLLVLHLVDKS